MVYDVQQLNGATNCTEEIFQLKVRLKQNPLLTADESRLVYPAFVTCGWMSLGMCPLGAPSVQKFSGDVDFSLIV